MEEKNRILKSKSKYLILLIVLLLVGTTVGIYCYLHQNNTEPALAEVYTTFEDGTYYIPKAEQDIKFEVDGDVNSYKITNSNNEIIASKIVEHDGKKYIQANQEYEKGETYQLTLEKAKFADENLGEVKNLEFKIVAEPKAEYQMADNVIEIDTSNIQVENETKLKVKNTKLEESQVVLVKEGSNIVDAYKILKVDGENIEVRKPEPSEIYSNVELYQEGQIDFNKFKLNEDAQIAIVKSIEESPLYKFLTTEVYAGFDEPKISFKPKGKDFYVEIELRFKADGEEKMEIEVLKQHDLVMKLSYKLSADFMADIKEGFNINFDMKVKNNVEMQVELESGDDYIKGISEISDAEYSKSVQEIVQKLQNEVPDVSANSIDIGAIEVPTNIPGINVYMDVYFQTQLALKVNLSYNGQLECVDHFGFVMNKEGLRAYQNAEETSFTQEFSVTGKSEIKVGIGLDVGVSIINKDIAHAGIGAEFGAYNEYFATTQVNLAKRKTELDSGIYAKIELGVYLQVKVDCSVDVVFYKIELKKDLVEMKIPVLKLDDNVIWSGDGVALENNTKPITNININKIDDSKEIVYIGDQYDSDAYSNVLYETLHYTYKYPVININSTDVKSINAEIKEKYGFTDEDKEWLQFMELEANTYDYYINGNVLSVVALKGGNDSTETTAYNIDLTTGNKMNNTDLLNNKNINLDNVKSKLREFAINRMDLEVQRMSDGNPNSSVYELADWYEKQFNETLENSLQLLNNIYLNADGDICIRIEFETLGGQEYCMKIAEMNVSKMSNPIEISYQTYLDDTTRECLKGIRSEVVN